MKKNVASWDRIVRVVLGIVLLALYLTNAVSGVLGIVLMVVGAVLLATAIIGFCPLYHLLKINTVKS